MKSLIIASVISVSLAGCVAGVKTGPLSDPEVLAQRCAEANLAISVFDIASKGKNTEKIEKARTVLATVCNGGVITDYPSALNAIANALLILK